MTGLLTTCGDQFHDWSAAYRLFSKDRLPVPEIFGTVRRAVAAQLAADAPFRAVIDDTLLRRAGLRTPGVAWRRDPLGPHFQTNLVRAQRFLQISAALPGTADDHRLIPISFLHAPTPRKPSPKASSADREQYRLHQLECRLSQRACHQILQLRQDLNSDPDGAQRLLVMAFDGGFTNATVLKNIPPRTVYIGRIRKDAKLCFPPDPALRKPRGRRTRYGSDAPTPEQVRQDDFQPWETMSFQHSGVTHQLRFKRISNLMWRIAGAEALLQLVVIAPLGYRHRQAGRLLFRDPAYLICTDPAMDPRQIINTYFERWDIEVNFREEKTLLGVGQAQVRAETSVESAPALTVASYAMLLIAARQAFGNSSHGLLPQPKWADSSKNSRVSTQRLLHQLRAEVWGRGLGLQSFSGFAPNHDSITKPTKSFFPLDSAVFYANG